MIYTVEYKKAALKALKKMDKMTARLIVSWIERNLVGCSDPRAHGKALSANLGGSWRYRVGDYRIIADISDKTITILILEIGHRSEIYL